MNNKDDVGIDVNSMTQCYTFLSIEFLNVNECFERKIFYCFVLPPKMSTLIMLLIGRIWRYKKTDDFAFWHYENIAKDWLMRTVCLPVVSSTKDNYQFLKGMRNLVAKSGYKLKICHEYVNRGDRWMQVRKLNVSLFHVEFSCNCHPFH